MRLFLYSLVVAVFLGGCAGRLPSGYKLISQEKDESIVFKYDEFRGITFFTHRYTNMFLDPIFVEIAKQNPSSYDSNLSLIVGFANSNLLISNFHSVYIINENGGRFKLETLLLNHYKEIVLDDNDVETFYGVLKGGSKIRVRFDGIIKTAYILNENQHNGFIRVIEYYNKIRG